MHFTGGTLVDFESSVDDLLVNLAFLEGVAGGDDLLANLAFLEGVAGGGVCYSVCNTRIAM